jgi:hypothetical protein
VGTQEAYAASEVPEVSAPVQGHDDYATGRRPTTEGHGQGAQSSAAFSGRAEGEDLKRRGKIKKMPTSDPGPLVVRVGGQTLRVDVDITDISDQRGELLMMPKDTRSRVQPASEAQRSTAEPNKAD